MIRFPPTLLDRAGELISRISDESIVSFFHAEAQKKKEEINGNKSKSFNSTTDEFSNEISDMEKDAFDLYSYILLLMSTDSDKKYDYISIDVINQKLHQLIETLSPAFRDLLREESLEHIISILNASRSSF